MDATDSKRQTLTVPGGGSATLVHSRSLGRAVLITKDMPKAPSDKVYELWLQDAEGVMRPAGLMTGGLAHQTVVLRGNAGESTGVGITVEPAGGSKSPTTDAGRPVRLPEVRMSTPTRRVAVVGSGVSGLVAGWVLARDSHVTLYEADDRLGGHADTHDVQVGERTRRRRHRLHRAQRAHLPDAAAAVRRARRPDAGVRHEHVGARRGDRPRVGRRPRRRRACSRRAANLRNPRYLRMLTEIPRFHRMAKKVLASAARRPATDDETLDDVPRARPVHRLLRHLLHDAAGLRGLVDRPRPRPGLPGPLPVPVPRAPRHAHRLRVAHVAHRHRRLARVRRAGGQGPATRCGSRRRSRRSASTPTASTSPTRPAPRRTTPSSSPPTPTRRWRCSPTPTRPAPRGARRDPLRAQRRAAAHRRAAAAARRGRPRLLELPAPRRRAATAGCWSPTT